MAAPARVPPLRFKAGFVAIASCFSHEFLFLPFVPGGAGARCGEVWPASHFDQAGGRLR